MIHYGTVRGVTSYGYHACGLIKPSLRFDAFSVSPSFLTTSRFSPLVWSFS